MTEKDPAKLPNFIIDPDGRGHVIDEPVTAWDRDVRAFVDSLIADRGNRTTLVERNIYPEEIVAQAVWMADDAENARRARAAQKPGTQVGRCTNVAHNQSRWMGQRCILLDGHDEDHEYR